MPSTGATQVVEDRWLTIDDYVDGYLNECIEFICREHGLDSINVLGICEGGVFYACATPRSIRNGSRI